MWGIWAVSGKHWPNMPCVAKNTGAVQKTVTECLNVPVTDANISGSFHLLSFTRLQNKSFSANSSCGSEFTKLCLFTHPSLRVVLLLNQTSATLSTFTKIPYVFLKRSCSTTIFSHSKWNMLPGSVCVVQPCKKICCDMLMHHTWESPLYSTQIHSSLPNYAPLAFGSIQCRWGFKAVHIVYCSVCFVTGCSCCFVSWQSHVLRHVSLTATL